MTPHSLRHTWATLHLARGTPIEWVRQMGGWSSAKMLLDVYSHYIRQAHTAACVAVAPEQVPLRGQPRSGAAAALPGPLVRSCPSAAT